MDLRMDEKWICAWTKMDLRMDEKWICAWMKNGSAHGMAGQRAFNFICTFILNEGKRSEEETSRVS